MSSNKIIDTVPKTGSQKRRIRRKKIKTACTLDDAQASNVGAESKPKKETLHPSKVFQANQACNGPSNLPNIVKIDIGTMTNDPVESREKVKAAREAKKLAKQQAKMKRDAGLDIKQPAKAQGGVKKEVNSMEPSKVVSKDDELKKNEVKGKVECSSGEQPKEIKSDISPKQLVVEDMSEDEVDRAVPVKIVKPPQQQINSIKEQVKAQRAAKKAARDARKMGTSSCDASVPAIVTPKAVTEMTVRDVIETLKDIKVVALEVIEVTAELQTIQSEKEKQEKITSPAKVEGEKSTETKLQGTDIKPSEETTKVSAKPEDGGKSKAELRAERRAKQEAQRAAKEAATQVKAATAKPAELIAQPGKDVVNTLIVKEKSPKPKTPKQTAKPQGHKVSWFRHLYNEDDKEKLNKIPINSNLHPAIIKLGVQLATRVVTGSNARCIALLDALKKMVQDYSLPAKTEFGRGLDAHLASSLEFLWGMRQPTASQTNAVKFFRHHLTQLPNNVDEFDAKKTLQEEIDRYIREQIDMAGEAISIAVRNKICKGDNILTYGCSSLIERILVDAHRAGVEFRAVVCGGGVAARAAREMTRRLVVRGVPCICVDITALSFVMRTINKVVLGCSSLLANGSVLGAAGTAAVALAARAFNKPVLVACETHKFSERVQTDAFVYNEIGDPDDLIDKSDENSPLKDWRSNPNLTPLNLTYDVTPPNLVTAVVTELAILPCTSAPVVLRFKLSEYSI